MMTDAYLDRLERDAEMQHEQEMHDAGEFWMDDEEFDAFYADAETVEKTNANT